MKRRCSPVPAFVALVLLASACRSTAPIVPDDLPENRVRGKGVVHRVQKGQTLWRIAQAYGVPVQELAEVNDLPDPTLIQVEQALWIPRAVRVVEVPPAPSLVGSQPAPSKTETRPGRTPPTKSPVRNASTETETPEKVKVERSRFMWPVKGTVYSRFGVREGVQHDGIDISAAKGTPIVAADDGEVLYSGTQRGYGNLVLIRHADGLITIYAHNDSNRVRQGQKVKRGEVIATVGQTGRASGPHLHFEVRKDRLPRNPLFFLP